MSEHFGIGISKQAFGGLYYGLPKGSIITTSIFDKDGNEIGQAKYRLLGDACIYLQDTVEVEEVECQKDQKSRCSGGCSKKS